MPETTTIEASAAQTATFDPLKVVRLDIAHIKVGDRMRKLDQDCVNALAGSISKLGLQNPLTVFAMPKGGGCTYELVAGQHRLEAVKTLRWNQIDCVVRCCRR